MGVNFLTLWESELAEGCGLRSSSLYFAFESSRRGAVLARGMGHSGMWSVMLGWGSVPTGMALNHGLTAGWVDSRVWFCHASRDGNEGKIDQNGKHSLQEPAGTSGNPERVPIDEEHGVSFVLFYFTRQISAAQTVTLEIIRG